MKITILLFLLTSVHSFAQITLDTSSHPHVGTSYNIYYFDALDPAIIALTGPNQVWDFSKRGFAFFEQQTFLAASGFPESINFPTANLVLDTNSSNDNRWYYSSTSNGLSTQGYYNFAPNNTYYVENDNPGDFNIITPLAYGDTFTLRNAYCDTIISSGFQGTTRNCSGESKSFVIYKVSVDGWGVIKLPDNVNYDVLKATVKKYDVVQYYKNINGTDMLVDSIYDYSLGYVWYANTYYPIIVEYINDSLYSTYLLYFQPSSSNITYTVPYSLVSNINIYPNPSSGSFTVKVENNEAIQIGVYNSMGQEVKSVFLNHTSNIVIEDAVPGIYFVTATSATGKTTQKMIIE